MLRQYPKKKPERERDADNGSAPRTAGGNRWRELILGNMAMIVAGPFIGMIAGFLLLFGGIFLAVAWQAGPQQLVDSTRFAGFTGAATARIVESWVTLDFNPDDVRSATAYWQPSARISSCAVVEYGGDWGAPLRRAFCGNRFAFSEDFRLDNWDSLAPGIPFAFSRDASGFAVEEIRLSKIALDWLKSHPPPSTFMLSKPPPTTALAALREELDHPADVAIASWSTPVPSFPVAFDPQHPAEAMPAKYVDDRRQPWLGGFVFTLLLAVPGLFVWRAGMSFLFGGQTRGVFWLLMLVPLLALPWWSDALPALLKHVSKDWASIAIDMLDDINRVTRMTASAPGDALLAGGERIVWQLDKSAYAETFGRIHFALPQPMPATSKAALAALEDQVAVQVHALDSVAQTTLFIQLRKQKDAGLDQVQYLFAPAAEQVVRDASSGLAAHKAAKSFLIFAAGSTYYEDQLDAMEGKPQPQ